MTRKNIKYVTNDGPLPTRKLAHNPSRLETRKFFIQGDIQRPVTYAYIDHDLLLVESTTSNACTAPATLMFSSQSSSLASSYSYALIVFLLRTKGAERAIVKAIREETMSVGGMSTRPNFGLLAKLSYSERMDDCARNDPIFFRSW